MIHIYSITNSTSVMKSKKFFDDKKIQYETESLSKITVESLLKILKISPDLEFLINRRKIKTLDWNTKFLDILKQIKEKPSILKAPIIVDYENQIIVTGYQKDNIDIFLRFKKVIPGG